MANSRYNTQTTNRRGAMGGGMMMKKPMMKVGGDGKKIKKAFGPGSTNPKKSPGKKNLKKVDAKKNPGLAKLPTQVRNKMGFMKKGGKVK